ncbi:hypothetical protein [uncultured Pseudomonas sp.]|uniref:hypothetical protein n=1 Tax=uncultured Pseudomonas sp. TaxID=114707 RepID=UPI0027DE75F6|nr:hypothetical protein [uncultured Pseudomonas sp.]
MDVHIDASKVSAEELAEMLRANPGSETRINIKTHAVSQLRDLADAIESGTKKLHKAEIISTPELLPLFAYTFIAE